LAFVFIGWEVQWTMPTSGKGFHASSFHDRRQVSEYLKWKRLRPNLPFYQKLIPTETNLPIIWYDSIYVSCGLIIRSFIIELSTFYTQFAHSFYPEGLLNFTKYLFCTYWDDYVAYNKAMKLLWKELKRGTKRWKYVLCSWIKKSIFSFQLMMLVKFNSYIQRMKIDSHHSCVTKINLIWVKDFGIGKEFCVCVCRNLKARKQK
jgi:hypothetical protein